MRAGRGFLGAGELSSGMPDRRPGSRTATSTSIKTTASRARFSAAGPPDGGAGLRTSFRLRRTVPFLAPVSDSAASAPFPIPLSRNPLSGPSTVRVSLLYPGSPGPSFSSCLLPEGGPRELTGAEPRGSRRRRRRPTLSVGALRSRHPRLRECALGGPSPGRLVRTFDNRPSVECSMQEGREEEGGIERRGG